MERSSGSLINVEDFIDGTEMFMEKLIITATEFQILID